MGIFGVAATAYSSTFEISRAVLLIDTLLTLLAAGGVRLSVRAIAESRDRQRERERGVQKRVLVVGAGNAGAMVVREMHRNPQLGMVPVGFLDDEATKIGKRIHGVPVLGPIQTLARVVEERRIAEVIIAMPTAPGATLRAIAEDCRRTSVASRTMPGVYEMLDGNVSVSRLRQIDITDLLGRKQIVATDASFPYLMGRTVLITGAGGSIGFELCRQVAHAGAAQLVLLGHGENSIFDARVQLRALFPQVGIEAVIADIRDRERLMQVFKRVRPEVVFHAAAHKHVPLMEDNPEEAITNNVIGTQNVVEAAIAAGTRRLVAISTDKAVAPTSIMGASKRMAEWIVIDAARRAQREYSVVRFGNVLGSRGSVVPFFKHQIEQGGPVTVTHPEMRRFFMTIPEAVFLVLQAGGIGRGGEVLVLNMGQPVLIVELAQDLIRLSGLEPSDIPIQFTGIRKGEKLEEALWEAGAVTEPTSLPDVIKVVESQPGQDLAQTMRALEQAVAAGDRLGIEAALAQTMATFVPASSGVLP
ncbi:MAG: polysaccharide biosynthesis protein [Vicinamibacterales bacterium]